MAIVKPFKALRPRQDLVEQVASLPYDVMNRVEAKQMAAGNPHSFLHVVRSEMDVPDDMEMYDPVVYQTARRNLDKMQSDGILLQDETPRFYIYRQLMWGRVQTGIVACTSIDDYLNDIIKKHEFTRPVKEQDRINNFDYCDANTAPIFLAYRRNRQIDQIVNDWIKFHKPDYNFISEDDITHIVWQITSDQANRQIEAIFGDIDYLYIADGHHRSASSVKVGLKRRAENPNYDGTEEYNFFMSVLFPDEDLFIMDYNRVVKDLNGLSVEDFKARVATKFDLEAQAGDRPYKPTAKKNYGMYLDGQWYKLTAKAGIYDADDPVDRLDVSILQNNLLNPILGIADPRTDNRIDFIGGIRGLAELEKRCQNNGAVAFSMYPTTMDDLLAIADAGEVMPPKSTWFEPKLRSGLFVHKLSD